MFYVQTVLHGSSYFDHLFYTEERQPQQSLTDEIAEFISQTTYDNIPCKTKDRSKRMILDCIGNSVIGAQTDISKTLRRLNKQEYPFEENCRIWGTDGEKTTPSKAAFLNGASAHSMDFDDTWHPATHPSSPVLPCLIALIGHDTGEHAYSSRDLLTAFNVGVQVQGILLRCSKLANDIPKR